MDDITSRLTGLGVTGLSDPSEREQRQPRVQIIEPQLTYEDALIETLLQQELEAYGTDSLITADHEVFATATAFCDQWDIPEQALENFIALTCGNSRFPVIVLQNPSWNHDREGFRDMVRKCPTLLWLENVLKAIGLTLDDVIILDICPLLSDKWMNAHSKSNGDQAILEALELAESVLDCLKPKILISCQCQTSSVFSRMGGLATEFARKLGSSTSRARQKCVLRFYHRTHIFHVAQAYHPRYFIGRDGPETSEREATLRAVLQHFFEPCGQWKVEVEELLQLEEAICNYASALERLAQSVDRLLTTMEAKQTYPSETSQTMNVQ